jgi:hypothetical protein
MGFPSVQEIETEADKGEKAIGLIQVDIGAAIAVKDDLDPAIQYQLDQQKNDNKNMPPQPFFFSGQDKE